MPLTYWHSMVLPRQAGGLREAISNCRLFTSFSRKENKSIRYVWSSKRSRGKLGKVDAAYTVGISLIKLISSLWHTREAGFSRFRYRKSWVGRLPSKAELHHCQEYHGHQPGRWRTLRKPRVRHFSPGLHISSVIPVSFLNCIILIPFTFTLLPFLPSSTKDAVFCTTT